MVAAKAAAAKAAAVLLAVEVQEDKLVQMMAHLNLEQTILEQFQLLSQPNILKKRTEN